MDTSQPPVKDPSVQTRYQRVRAILDAAAGKSCADYQGYGKFWNLPLDRFLEVTIYGIRMIAPATAGDHCDRVMNDPDTDKPGRTAAAQEAPPACPSCACAPAAENVPAPAAPASSPAYPGHSAKSGLIQGLKGQFPFDGSQFPRLPWGGTAVAPSDIQIISSWIDDGCPATDAQATADASDGPDRGLLDRRAAGLEAHPVSEQSVNSFKEGAGEPKLRKNVENLSTDELCKLRYAVNELMKLNKWPLDNRAWNSWARLHGDECQHGWEQFLPWHRIYLYQFEQALQDVVPDVTLPYWDWPAQEYAAGKIPPGGVSGIIPGAYRCWLNQQAIDNLTAAGVPSGISRLLNQVFNSGVEFFRTVSQAIGQDATVSYRPQILTQLVQVNPLWYEWRYPGMFFNPDGTPAQNGLAGQFNHHYPNQAEIDQILDVDNWQDFGGGPVYNQSFGILDMNPHNTIHIWVGGDSPKNDPVNPPPPTATTGDMLNNLTAAFDPIFWGHHSNVDRMWALWQKRHPGLNPQNPDDILSGLNFAIRDALSIEKLGYEYASSAHVFPTDRTMGIAKFRSAAAGVHPRVLGKFRKAEVRLSKLRQPPQSFTLRVFLNQPDADASTPIEGNDHYAGYLSIFGHGECIGGPGHCDDPPRGARPFDLRPQHHNRPYNARLDVTAAARKLVAQGATDLSVHLVVLAVDEKRMAELLRLDAVSLIFQD